MRPVLVTGGAGFIGSHLTRSLLDDGHHVVAIDDLSTGLYANVADLSEHPHFRLYVESIRNEPLMEQLMQQCGVVFHLASAVGVRLIMERPVYTIDNIYQGSEIVMRLARRYRNRVLLTSTSEVYGKSAEIPYREDGDRTEGPTTSHRWAYACAKALDEFLALAHWQETSLPVTIVRLFNTVGPRQRGRYGMVVPRFVQWALQDEPLQVYGDGSQSRCFCHIQDVVRALTGLVELDVTAGEVYNVGATEEVSMLSLAERVVDRLRSRSEIRLVPYDLVHGPGFEDMHRRLPSTDKIKQLMGWTPELDLDRIIDDVAADMRGRAHSDATQPVRPAPQELSSPI